MSNALVPVSFSEMKTLANAVAQSGLFGIKTPQEAFALMAIAQAEGMHPAIAARDYHIIHGRPTLKADAMLARFQVSGGKVEWHTYSDTIADATFSHPQGGTVRITWDMARVQAGQLGGNGMYKKFPRQMLRARTISEGIRTIYPGIAIGMYTPEEAEDMEPQKKAPVDATFTEVDQNAISAPDYKSMATTYGESLKVAPDQRALDDLLKDNEALMVELIQHAPKLHARILEIKDERVAFFCANQEIGDGNADPMPDYLARG